MLVGILADVVDDGVTLLRSRDRSFSHAPTDRPIDDLLLQRLLGELASTAYIAKAAVLDPTEAIAVATSSGASTPDGTPDAQLAQDAQLKVAHPPPSDLCTPARGQRGLACTNRTGRLGRRQDQVRRLLADHDARRVGMPADDRRHDRGIGDPQPVDPADP